MCKKCGTKCEKPLNEINRQKRNGKTKFYCSLKCATTHNHTIHSIVIRKCRWCKRKFETTTHKKSRKCCSLDCAHKQSQSFVNPENISKSMKLYIKHNPLCFCGIKRGGNRKATIEDRRWQLAVGGGQPQDLRPERGAGSRELGRNGVSTPHLVFLSPIEAERKNQKAEG